LIFIKIHISKIKKKDKLTFINQYLDVVIDHDPDVPSQFNPALNHPLAQKYMKKA